MIEVVSPTKVAAPCKLEETAIARSMETGLIFSFLHIARPTGAIIRTVATLSIKAETAPAKRDIKIITHITVGHFSKIISARRFGILDSMK